MRIQGTKDLQSSPWSGSVPPSAKNPYFFFLLWRKYHCSIFCPKIKGGKKKKKMNSNNSNESLVTKAWRIGLVVTAYWCVSISMVFLNKYLLSSPDVHLEAPIFITWYQCIVAVGMLYLLGAVRPQTFPPFEAKIDVCKKVMPLSCIFVGMIVFNNLCLKFVEVSICVVFSFFLQNSNGPWFKVSFYNVGRSLTTIFNVILSYVLLGSTTSGIRSSRRRALDCSLNQKKKKKKKSSSIRLLCSNCEWLCFRSGSRA